VIGDSLLVIRG